MANVLTVYYSRKGENYFSGGIRSIDKGNTEILAEAIHSAVGGDLFEIVTVKPYSDNYSACTQEAQEELRLSARPELKPCPASLDGGQVYGRGVLLLRHRPRIPRRQERDGAAGVPDQPLPA